MQASGFRDRTPDLQRLGATTLGITFSPPAELARWRAEIGLTTDLLSDADRAVALAYGAAESVSQAKAARLSVLIDAGGVVRRVYRGPDVAGHAGAVLADLAAL